MYLEELSIKKQPSDQATIKTKDVSGNNLCPIGWREWIELPELDIPFIKAKIDTGARTSALHAYFVEPYENNGERYVRFGLHPFRKKPTLEVICNAKVIDEREITNSGGHKEKRYVIRTLVKIGPVNKTIELTLTNRDTMKFKMLLGRTTLANDFYVDPARSFIMGKPKI